MSFIGDDGYRLSRFENVDKGWSELRCGYVAGGFGHILHRADIGSFQPHALLRLGCPFVIQRLYYCSYTSTQLSESFI